MSASLQREALRSPLPGGRAAYAQRAAAAQPRILPASPQPRGHPRAPPQQQQPPAPGQGARARVGMAPPGTAGAVLVSLAARASGIAMAGGGIVALDQAREGPPSGGRGGPRGPVPIRTPLPLRRPSTAAPRLAGAPRTPVGPQGPSRSGVEAAPCAVPVETLPVAGAPPPPGLGRGPNERAVASRDAESQAEQEWLALTQPLGSLGLTDFLPPLNSSDGPPSLPLPHHRQDVPDPTASLPLPPRPATSSGPRGSFRAAAGVHSSLAPELEDGPRSGNGAEAGSGEQLSQWPDWPWGFLARTRGGIDVTGRPGPPQAAAQSSPSHALLDRLASLSGRIALQDGLPPNSVPPRGEGAGEESEPPLLDKPGGQGHAMGHAGGAAVAHGVANEATEGIPTSAVPEKTSAFLEGKPAPVRPVLEEGPLVLGAVASVLSTWDGPSLDPPFPAPRPDPAAAEGVAIGVRAQPVVCPPAEPPTRVLPSASTWAGAEAGAGANTGLRLESSQGGAEVAGAASTGLPATGPVVSSQRGGEAGVSSSARDARLRGHMMTESEAPQAEGRLSMPGTASAGSAAGAMRATTGGSVAEGERAARRVTASPGGQTEASGELRGVVLELLRLAVKLGRPAGTLPTPQELREVRREDLEQALRAHGGRHRVLELFGLSTLAPQGVQSTAAPKSTPPSPCPLPVNPPSPRSGTPSKPSEPTQPSKPTQPSARAGDSERAPSAGPPMQAPLQAERSRNLKVGAAPGPAASGPLKRVPEGQAGSINSGAPREASRGRGSRVASLLAQPVQPRVLYAQSYTPPAQPTMPRPPTAPTPPTVGSTPRAAPRMRPSTPRLAPGGSDRGLSRRGTRWETSEALGRPGTPRQAALRSAVQPSSQEVQHKSGMAKKEAPQVQEGKQRPGQDKETVPSQMQQQLHEDAGPIQRQPQLRDEEGLSQKQQRLQVAVVQLRQQLQAQVQDMGGPEGAWAGQGAPLSEAAGSPGLAQGQEMGGEGGPEGAWAGQGAQSSGAPGSSGPAQHKAGATPGAPPPSAVAAQHAGSSPGAPLSWRERVQALEARLLSTQAALLSGRATLRSSAKLSGRAGRAGTAQAIPDAEAH